MTLAPRLARGWLPVAVLLAFVLFAAWRIVVIAGADNLADADPDRALHWLPDHPRALLALAERQLAADDVFIAADSARRLLAAAPLEGRAFRVLAEAASMQGDADRALVLYRIAERRSPRDLRTRAWLFEHALRAGDYPAALVQVDALLRTSPKQGRVLLPMLGQMAADPDFADALARLLATRPPWRGSLLSTLQRGKDPQATDAVLSALHREGGLDDAEFDGWIATLLRQERWGEAYGRWAGTLDLSDGVLPLVYNGGFAHAPSGRGFDWRTLRIPGVSIEFVPDRGADGLVAHTTFRGRAAPQVNLEQPLLLGPGSYRFSARVRAASLRSERGLEWTITCLGQRQPLAISEPLEGSFGWRQVEMDVVVPDSDCEGQWLRLRNPVPAGSIQRVRGEIWFDDVAMEPMK
jgi:tetratricopeptide (TPR) repeat protein